MRSLVSRVAVDGSIELESANLELNRQLDSLACFELNLDRANGRDELDFKFKANLWNERDLPSSGIAGHQRAGGSRH
jgi:hypothetical protein